MIAMHAYIWFLRAVIVLQCFSWCAETVCYDAVRYECVDTCSMS